MNDAAELASEAGNVIERAAAEHARRLHELARSQPHDHPLQQASARNESADLAEVARRAQARIDELYGQLTEGFLDSSCGGLVPSVDALVRALRGQDRSSDVANVPGDGSRAGDRLLTS
jgi:molecular chaperone GrpE (heat shock protein)